MSKLKKRWPLVMLIGLVLAVWIPCLFDAYSLADAGIITVSVLIGGYIGGKFLKSK